MKENTLYVERFRPTTLETYVGNQNVKDTIQKYLEQNDIQNFIFYGPPGSGKTTLAKILINELKEFNPDLLDKPRLLAITKSDLIDADLEKMLRKTLPKGIPALFISSVTGKNIQQLKDTLWEALNP
jgi:GTP-binding protein